MSSLQITLGVHVAEKNVLLFLHVYALFFISFSCLHYVTVLYTYTSGLPHLHKLDSRKILHDTTRNSEKHALIRVLYICSITNCFVQYLGIPPIHFIFFVTVYYFSYSPHHEMNQRHPDEEGEPADEEPAHDEAQAHGGLHLGPLVRAPASPVQRGRNHNVRRARLPVKKSKYNLFHYF